MDANANRPFVMTCDEVKTPVEDTEAVHPNTQEARGDDAGDGEPIPTADEYGKMPPPEPPARKHGDKLVRIRRTFKVVPEKVKEAKNDEKVDSIAKDEAVAMDAKKVATSFADCKAKNPMRCPYHGAAAMSDAFGKILAKHGLGDMKFSIEPVPLTDDDTTYHLEFDCPAELADTVGHDVLKEFGKLPAIDLDPDDDESGAISEKSKTGWVSDFQTDFFDKSCSEPSVDACPPDVEKEAIEEATGEKTIGDPDEDVKKDEPPKKDANQPSETEQPKDEGGEKTIGEPDEDEDEEGESDPSKIKEGFTDWWELANGQGSKIFKNKYGLEDLSDEDSDALENDLTDYFVKSGLLDYDDDGDPIFKDEESLNQIIDEYKKKVDEQQSKTEQPNNKKENGKSSGSFYDTDEYKELKKKLHEAEDAVHNYNDALCKKYYVKKSDPNDAYYTPYEILKTKATDEELAKLKELSDAFKKVDKEIGEAKKKFDANKAGEKGDEPKKPITPEEAEPAPLDKDEGLKSSEKAKNKTAELQQEFGTFESPTPEHIQKMAELDNLADQIAAAEDFLSETEGIAKKMEDAAAKNPLMAPLAQMAKTNLTNAQTALGDAQVKFSDAVNDVKDMNKAAKTEAAKKAIAYGKAQLGEMIGMFANYLEKNGHKGDETADEFISKEALKVTANATTVDSDAMEAAAAESGFEAAKNRAVNAFKGVEDAVQHWNDAVKKGKATMDKKTAGSHMDSINSAFVTLMSSCAKVISKTQTAKEAYGAAVKAKADAAAKAEKTAAKAKQSAPKSKKEQTAAMIEKMKKQLESMGNDFNKTVMEKKLKFFQQMYDKMA